jgi:hypothetical protein
MCLPAAFCGTQATEEISAFICPALVDDHGHAVLRLSMGRLLDTLLANMDDARQQAQVSAALGVPSSSSSGGGGSSGQAQQQQQHAQRLMMYSGHDSTIMPLLTGGLGLESWAVAHTVLVANPLFWLTHSKWACCIWCSWGGSHTYCNAQSSM